MSVERSGRLGGVEDEPWYLCAKGRSIGTGEQIVPFHESARRLEDAEARVFVHSARLDQRLFPNDPFALDLEVFAYRIVNQPPASEQVGILTPHVLDPAFPWFPVGLIQRCRLG